jgi:hypothetical protein
MPKCFKYKQIALNFSNGFFQKVTKLYKEIQNSCHLLRHLFFCHYFAIAKSYASPLFMGVYEVTEMVYFSPHFDAIYM